MRRLEQEIPGSGKGGCGPVLQQLQQVCRQMNIGTDEQFKSDAMAGQVVLQRGSGLGDALRGVTVYRRVYVGRTGQQRDAVCCCDARHLERHFQIFGTVIDTR